MRLSSRRMTWALAPLLAFGCADPAPPETTKPQPPSVPEPPTVEPEPRAEPEPPPPKICVGSKIPDGDHLQAATAWLEHDVVDGRFTCPAEFQLVQREPWFIATSYLTGGETDEYKPTPRVAIGERYVFSGRDPASGDALTFMIGRLDRPALERAQTKFPVEPAFEEPYSPGEPIADDWYGLGFVPRSGEEASSLRAWLAELPPDVREVSFAPAGHLLIGEHELVKRPKLLLVGIRSSTTICIEASGERTCWKTERLQPSYTELGKQAIEFHEGENELVATFDLRTRAWLPTKGRTFVAVDSIASPPLPANSFISMVAPDWLTAGEYEPDAHGMVEQSRWLLRRDAATWSIGALYGGLVQQRIEWPGIDEFGVIVGDRGQDYGSSVFLAFRRQGDWLLPAGHLPLPISGFMDFRSEYGWSYGYDIEAARKDRCITVAKIRASIWGYGDGREIVRKKKLKVPMPSLSGNWQLGPEGLVRGCD